MLPALLGASGTAWAQAYSAFSTDSIYGSLKHEESVSFNQAAAKVFANPKDKEILLWTSPLAGRTPVSGKLYADGSRQHDGLPCRMLHARLERGPNREDWEFWFCRQADGQWKAISQSRR
ncbi:hypothetical protein [Bordetella petrii]|uniref:hypothetical protein n=1 Tax=Bordetella petrii TaxID=94624 RepID=UPI001A971F16|nr:hypothetical protein [Bordetella petrii]MBO1113843.1 hypothetical protein [Bordetella petrii]